jgi:hypothetical protein
MTSCLSCSVRKLKFHERYPAFPGNLAMEKEALMMVGNNDAGNFYEMCIEFLDYLEDIINLETGVFESLGDQIVHDVQLHSSLVLIFICILFMRIRIY